MTQEEQWLLKEKHGGENTKEYQEDRKRFFAGEPLAYTIGTQPFLNVTVGLSERPHIPRAETEFWTEWAIGALKNDTRAGLSCLDIFAGSGCIGLAVLSNVSKASVDFADIDDRCIRQIEKNVASGGISTLRVGIIQSDVFEHVTRRYDYIFANPPYIACNNIERVESSVLCFEPHQALFGGEDGLDVIRVFLAEAPKYLNSQGRIFMEFDDTQQGVLEEMVRVLPYVNVRFSRDQYGLWRSVELAVL